MQTVARPRERLFDRTALWGAIGTAVAYVLAVRLGALFALPQANVSLIWPAAGVALAAVWTFGRPAVLAVALGAAAGQLLLGHGPVPAFAVALGASLAATLGTLALQRAAFDPALRRLGDVLRLVLIGGVGAGAVSSLIGASVMYAAGLAEWPGFGGLWWLCWVADLVGTLLVAPVILAWGVATIPEERGRLRSEAVVLLLAVAGIGWLVYSDVLPPGIAMARPLSYVVFPVMIWAAVRVRVRDTALLLLAHASIAIALTAAGHGPFADGTLRESLLALHGHIALLSVSALMLAAVIAERRSAITALADSESKYRLLVENQTDLIVKTDETGHILFASPTVTELFDRPVDRLIGRPFRELVSEADVRDPASPWHALLSPPFACYLERAAATGRGERWLGWAAKAIRDERGRLCGVVAVGRDVTARRQAEADSRVYLQELAHVGRLSAMGEMAAGLAHELNQPLCAITTYAQACLRLLDEETRPELRQATERIAANGERAGGIIRQMRAFVRKDQPDAVPLDLNATVRDVVGFTESDARQIGVRIRLDLTPDLPAVSAVEIQIHQVLVNLVRNAVEALGGVPSSRRRLTVTTRCDDGGVAILVEDTGPGLGTEVIDTVFDPFVSGKTDGMGLGLSISRSIIDNHGGTLIGENRSGGGARFSFRLPASATARESGGLHG